MHSSTFRRGHEGGFWGTDNALGFDLVCSVEENSLSCVWYASFSIFMFCFHEKLKKINLMSLVPNVENLVFPFKLLEFFCLFVMFVLQNISLDVTTKHQASAIP